MSYRSDKPPFIILGYDKDADVYIRLITVHYLSFEETKNLAMHIGSIGVRREKTGEPFDWLEVIKPNTDNSLFTVPCEGESIFSIEDE